MTRLQCCLSMTFVTHTFAIPVPHICIPVPRTSVYAQGVGSREWQGCDMSVYADMSGDWLKNYANLLPEMLEDGVRVMIYAGNLDLICNWWVV